MRPCSSSPCNRTPKFPSQTKCGSVLSPNQIDQGFPTLRVTKGGLLPLRHHVVPPTICELRTKVTTNHRGKRGFHSFRNLCRQSDGDIHLGVETDSPQEHAAGPASSCADARRQFPRVSFSTAVELRAPDGVAYGYSENISLGGMLVGCEAAFAPDTRVLVSFILRGSGRLQIQSRVVHCRSGMRVGLQFLDLSADQKTLLSNFTQPTITAQRRSPRIPVRLFVQLCWTDHGRPAQVPAETVLISRHGCLVLTEAAVHAGASISVCWPECKMTAQTRVVSRQDCVGELARVALEFTGVDDFWGPYFPAAAGL